MKRFVQGDNRNQSFLLPEALDGYVTDIDPVRVVDVFVDELDLHKLGFEGVEPALTGRPSYHPEVMLKIYIYGHRNRIQSCVLTNSSPIRHHMLERRVVCDCFRVGSKIPM